MSTAAGPAGDLPATTALPGGVAPAVPAVADEHICVDVPRVRITRPVANLFDVHWSKKSMCLPL